MLRLLDVTAGTAWHAFFLLAVTTGARHGELCALHWSNLGLDDGIATIRAGLSQNKYGIALKTTKTERVRVVPLTLDCGTPQRAGCRAKESTSEQPRQSWVTAHLRLRRTYAQVLAGAQERAVAVLADRLSAARKKAAATADGQFCRGVHDLPAQLGDQFVAQRSDDACAASITARASSLSSLRTFLHGRRPRLRPHGAELPPAPRDPRSSLLWQHRAGSLIDAADSVKRDETSSAGCRSCSALLGLGQTCAYILLT